MKEIVVSTLLSQKSRHETFASVWKAIKHCNNKKPVTSALVADASCRTEAEIILANNEIVTNLFSDRNKAECHMKNARQRGWGCIPQV